MPILDVFKERQFNIVKLNDRDLKVPNEYTVEEVERLLELDEKRNHIEEEQVSKDKPTQEAQLVRFWAVVFDQLEVIFQHYQPELTAVELRKLISHKEALGILGFYEKYRHLNQKKSGIADKDKKKT